MAVSNARDNVTGLTIREAEVIALYDGVRSGREIAEEIGTDPNTVYLILARPHVREAVRQRVHTERLAPLVADRQEREIFWTAVMRNHLERTSDRMKAAEYLGKAQGDFIERHEHSGKDGSPLRFSVVTGIARSPNQPTEDDFDDL